MSNVYNPLDVYLVQRNETSSSFVEKVLTFISSSVITFDQTGSVVAVPFNYFVSNVVDLSGSYFLKNKTLDTVTEIQHNDSIFNPSNLLIQNSQILIVDSTSDYYVLGELSNSGSLVVNGVLQVGGGLHSSGPITGSGVIL